MKILKYIPILIVVLFSTFILSSCVSHKSENIEKIEIFASCNGIYCSLNLSTLEMQAYTNILGVTNERLIKATSPQSFEDEINWVIPNGRLATNHELNAKNLPPCAGELDGECHIDKNPTGWVFNSIGEYEVVAKGSIYIDGKKQDINTNTNIVLKEGTPIINAEFTGPELTYDLVANTDGTGIPDDATFKWYIGDINIGSGKEIQYNFPANRTNYEVVVIITDPALDEPLQTTSDIYIYVVDDSLKPIINQPTVNGKLLNLSFDGRLSNYPNDTIYTWSIDGITENKQGEQVSFTVPNYNTTYTINLKSKLKDGTEIISDSINAKSGVGTPSIDYAQSQTVQTDYKFTADISNTGLNTADIKNYKWTIDGTEQAENTSSIDKSLAIGSHTIGLSIIYDISGGTDEVIDADDINLDVNVYSKPNLTNTVNPNNPLEITLSADLSGSDVDDTWTRTWSFGDSDNNSIINTNTSGEIVDGKDTIKHKYDLTNKDYTVTYTAKKGSDEIITTMAVKTNTVNKNHISININPEANTPKANNYLATVDYNAEDGNSDTQYSGVTQDWTFEKTATITKNAQFGIAVIHPPTIQIGDSTETATSQSIKLIKDITSWSTFNTIDFTIKFIPPNGSGDDEFSIKRLYLVPGAYYTPFTVDLAIDESEIGITAERLATEINKHLPSNVTSVTVPGETDADGNKIIRYTCELWKFAVSVPIGETLDIRFGPGFNSTYQEYISVIYDKDTDSFSTGNGGYMGYNQYKISTNANMWGLNCNIYSQGGF